MTENRVARTGLSEKKNYSAGPKKTWILSIMPSIKFATYKTKQKIYIGYSYSRMVPKQFALNMCLSNLFKKNKDTSEPETAKKHH